MLHLSFLPPAVHVDLNSSPAGKRTIDLLRRQIAKTREKVLLSYLLCALPPLAVEMISSSGLPTLAKPIAVAPAILALILAGRFDAAVVRMHTQLEDASNTRQDVALDLARTNSIVGQYVYSIRAQGRALTCAECSEIVRYAEALPVAPVRQASAS